MALDINIFVSNKNDELQRALAILDIINSEKDKEYYFNKNNISNDIVKASKILFKKYQDGKISFKRYDTLNVDNYREFI